MLLMLGHPPAEAGTLTTAYLAIPTHSVAGDFFDFMLYVMEMFHLIKRWPSRP